MTSINSLILKMFDILFLYAFSDYATIKGKDSGAEIKYSMRTKISAMVSSNRKRNSTL